MMTYTNQPPPNAVSDPERDRVLVYIDPRVRLVQRDVRYVGQADRRRWKHLVPRRGMVPETWVVRNLVEIYTLGDWRESRLMAEMIEGER